MPACMQNSASTRRMVAVENTRGGIGKHSMLLNDATPYVEVDPETYEVRADGELLTCEPAHRAADGAAVFSVLRGCRIARRE